MTLGQTSKINMFLGVLPFMEKTSDTWQAIGIMQSFLDQYKSKLAALQADHTLQEELTTGYALNKAKNREAMARAAYRIKSGLQAYSSMIEDDILYFKVNFSLTSLMEGSATSSKSKCEMIYNEAKLVIDNLGPYGVIAADLMNLQTKIDEFYEIISSPKSVKGLRKAVNVRIREKIKEIDKILKTKMDKAANALITIADNWVEEYFAERKIYHAKTSFTEIIATFKNKETGDVVEGVTLKGTGNKGGEFSAVSSSIGIADKKQISPEIYNLSWEIPGFASREMKQVKISPGEKEKLVIELVPSG